MMREFDSLRVHSDVLHKGSALARRARGRGSIPRTSIREPMLARDRKCEWQQGGVGGWLEQIRRHPLGLCAETGNGFGPCFTRADRETLAVKHGSTAGLRSLLKSRSALLPL